MGGTKINKTTGVSSGGNTGTKISKGCGADSKGRSYTKIGNNHGAKGGAFCGGADDDDGFAPFMDDEE